MKLKVLRRRLVTWLAVNFGWLLLRALQVLARPLVVDRRYFDDLRRKKRSILIAVWHGRILYPILTHSGLGITPMVSLSRDGEMIAGTVEKLGYRTIRGSTSRRSKDAMEEMIRLLRQPGEICAIMPDGPRGPRHRLQPGVVHIARRSGAVILPLTFRAERPIEFDSWDRFNFWKPFSRVLLLYGEPIEMDPQGDFEEQSEYLREEMVELESRADRWFEI